MDSSSTSYDGMKTDTVLLTTETISSPYTTPKMADRENETDSEIEDMPSEEVLQSHIYYVTAESENALYAPHQIDLRYGSTKGQELDIFGIDLPNNAPILVYVPGGFWKQMSKDISRFPALPLYGAGIKTFVVGYDLRQKATIWDIVDQVEFAVCYAIRYAEEKGSRGVYLAGHCSGAHLIAQVLANFELFESSVIKRLEGVYLISGIYDLRNFCDTPATDAVHVNKIDSISLSPLYNTYTHLVNTKIRFYILAGQNDSTMLKKQSRDFYDLLQDICPTNNMYFEIKDGMNHFDMVECFSSEDNYLKRMILNDISKHS